MAIRVVIDTNVWISSLLVPTGHPAQLRRGWEDGKFKLIVSGPLLDEFVEVSTVLGSGRNTASSQRPSWSFSY